MKWKWPPRIKAAQAKISHKRELFRRYIHYKRLNGLGELRQMTDEEHVCMNCGTRFKGNYCPRCSQSVKEKRLTWSAILGNLMAGITNVGSGFPRTCLEMFFRPGYMVRDFIKGKRVPYFKPFQMLFVLAAVLAIETTLIYPNGTKSDDTEMANDSITPQQRDSVLTLFYQEAAATVDTSSRKAVIHLLESRVDRLDDQLKERAKALPKAIIHNANADTLALQFAKDSKRSDILSDELKRLNRIEYASTSSDEKAFDFLQRMSNSIDNLKKMVQDKENHPYIAAIYETLKGWVNGNPAVVLLLMLPLYVIATKRVHRKRSVIHYNWVETAYAYGYIFSQQLLILIFLALFTASYDNYSAPITVILICWYSTELYQVPFKRAFWQTVRIFLWMALYVFILAILFSGLSVGVIELISLLQ